MVLEWVKTPRRHDVPGGVFLRPMRIMSSSENVQLDIKGGDFELSPHGGLARNSVRGLVEFTGSYW